jgi:hypothetical protein
MASVDESLSSREDDSRVSGKDAVVDVFFAKLARDGVEELRSLLTLLRAAPLLKETVDAMPIPVSILNSKGQAVIVNRCWARSQGTGDEECVLGKRHGELLGCIHVDEGDDGCGTSRHCERCGAMLSIVASQRTRGRTIRGYHLDRAAPEGHESGEFTVMSTPIEVDGQKFIIFAVLEHG